MYFVTRYFFECRHGTLQLLMRLFIRVHLGVWHTHVFVVVDVVVVVFPIAVSASFISHGTGKRCTMCPVCQVQHSELHPSIHPSIYIYIYSSDRKHSDITGDSWCLSLSRYTAYIAPAYGGAHV